MTKLQKIRLADGSEAMVETIEDTGRQYPMTDWHDPKKHPPTHGVSSSYVPVEYPKAVYLTYDKFIEVNSKDEEAAVMAANPGASLDYHTFPPPIVTSDDRVADMARQLAALQVLIAATRPAPVTAPAFTTSGAVAPPVPPVVPPQPIFK